jgi:hypothetical protein
MTKSLTDKLMKNSSAKWFYNKVSKNMMSKSLLKTDLLHNKVFLYVVFALSLANLLIWIVGGDIVNVIIFLLVGFLTAFFSKNMIVILLFALVVSNVIKFGIHVGKEGFSEGVEEEGEGEGKRAEGVDGEDAEGVDGEDAEGVDGEDAEGVDGEDVEGVDGEDVEGVDGEGIEGVDGERGRMNEPTGNVVAKSGRTDISATTDMEISGIDNEGNVIAKKVSPDTRGNTTPPGSEGMQTMGYTFIAQGNQSSPMSTMLEQQNKLLSNISTLSPYVINVDNEAKLRSQMKYSEYVKH